MRARLSSVLMAAGVVLVTAAAASTPALAQCKLTKVAELPLVMDGNRPLAEIEVNGQKALALVDTGAFNSLFWRGAAERMGLNLMPLRGLKVGGIGGMREAQSVVLKELKIGGGARKNLQMLVAGQGVLGRHDVVMLIGQDMLSKTDVEIDLANKAIRLFQPENCANQALGYWSADYSEAPIEAVQDGRRHLITQATLNGRRIRAMMDTGAFTSVVSTEAAARVGVTPATKGVEEAGRMRGVGKGTLRAWVAPFQTFQLGDETITNAKLRMADLAQHHRRARTGTRIAVANQDAPEMIIGADFFRSHRVYVAYSQKKIYFTYNGGPVFQVVGPALGDEGEEDEAGAEAEAPADPK